MLYLYVCFTSSISVGPIPSSLIPNRPILNKPISSKPAPSKQLIMKLFQYLPSAQRLIKTGLGSVALPSVFLGVAFGGFLDTASGIVPGVVSETFLDFSAQPAVAQDLPTLPLEFDPNGSPNPGRPGGRRRGGGTRGSCQAGIPLTAIAPAQSTQEQVLGVTQVVETVGALTTQIQPTLWFYIPGNVGEVATEFVIKDSSDRVLYEGQLAGQTASSGVIGVPLPIEMAPNNAYHWFLTVDCDETERVVVDGWVERQGVGPDASRTLTQATARNRAALYANYGFWQDALSELAQLRRENVEDEAIAQDWRRLMEALALPELAEAAVLSCCEAVDEVAVPEAIAPEETTEEATPEEATIEIPAGMPAEAIEIERERDGRSVLERVRDRGN